MVLKVLVLYPGHARMHTALVARQLKSTPQHLKNLLPPASSRTFHGPKKSIAVKTKGAAPDSFSSGRSPMICLLMILLFFLHTMHLLATALASLLPPGMSTVRRTLAVMSRTVMRWSSAWASSVIRRARSSEGMRMGREDVPSRRAR